MRVNFMCAHTQTLFYMKKTLFVLLTLLSAAVISAKDLYLNTGGSSLWNQAGAKFAIWSWTGSGNGTWSAFMSQYDGDIFVTTISDNADHVIFARINSDASAPDWNKVWNQTEDLSLSTENMYTITGWGQGEGAKSTGTWGTAPAPKPVEAYIAGNGIEGNPWCCGLNWDEDGCKMENNTITFDNVPAGQYAFKITDGTWDRNWGYAAVDATTSTKGYVSDADGNVVFTIDATATITITFANNKIQLVSSVPFVKSWTGSVPAQCTDIMLQGFFYDSYEVDESHPGTLEYGDTRWTTLQKKAGQIGASFDMIWLPPSALASGTGYHPRQFSNQNSDWGSRADLQNLIRTFHNVGTKVIADVVINHIEAMGSWCDFSVQNFAEYGIFEPDGSWICNTDEMNWEKYKADTLAGKCWGTATGNPDDGENWEGARDWSHDMPKVQDMFKAYLQWLKNVIGYDGWRYDKGDGFNNWHMWNYNNASHPEFAVMECWKGNNEIKWHIDEGRKDIAAFDFQNKYYVFNEGIAQGNFERCGVNGKMDWGDAVGLIQTGYQRNAVTFIDNHDTFLRNDQEFGGYGKSLTAGMKTRLLQANAWLLSMPGVPCVLYTHWVKYQKEIDAMINARRVAGVHSESEVKEEEVSGSGYKATVVGLNGYLIITLGDKTIQEATGDNKWLADNHYEKMASGTGYALWVTRNHDVAPRIIATPECSFEDAIAGIKVGMTTVGGTGSGTIYYSTDPNAPLANYQVYTDSLTFTQTTTLKAYAKVGEVQSNVYTFTYTYREPLKRGIQVHFQKPDIWDEVYYYAWLPGVDSVGNPTSTNIIGAYPGQRIYRDMEGWYSYEFDLSLDSVHFCISSGDKCGQLNIRSNDLLADYDAYYTWETGFESEEKHELKLDGPIDLHPDFDVEVSPESSYFRSLEEGQVVKLSVVGRKGATIYYTTDGTDPGKCANPATDSVTIVLHESSHVQAYAFDLNTKEYSDTIIRDYTYKAPQEGAMTVRFIKPHDWDKICLYAFTRVKVGSKFKDTPYALDGKASSKVWPGLKWTTFETQINPETGLTDSVYYYTFPEDIKDIYVIFNIGSNKTQTQDIYLVENTCYVWNNDCRKAVADETCTGVITGLEQVFNAISTTIPNRCKLLINDRIIVVRDGMYYDLFGRKIK